MPVSRGRRILAAAAVTTAVVVPATQCPGPTTPPDTTTTTLVVSVPPTTPITVTTAKPTTTVAPTTVVPTTSVAGSVTVKPSGGDDTAVLVAAVKANPTVTISGHLLINQVAEFKDVTDRHIIFAPDGALIRTVRPLVTTFQVLSFVNSSRIIIDDLRVIGPNIEVCDWDQYIPANGPLNPAHYDHIGVGYNAKAEEEHGLEIYGGSDITVNRGAIYGMSGDGVALTFDRATGANATRVTLNDVTTECTGRAGISNTGSDNVTVNRGSFSRAGYWVFNIEPFTSHSVSNYTLNDPTVGYSNQAWLFSSGPNYSCKVTNVNVNRPKPPQPQPLVAGCTAAQVHVNP